MNRRDLDEANGRSRRATGPMVGIYGTLSLQADGSWSYLLDDEDADTQAIAGGGTAVDSFVYTIADIHGATGTATLSITVAGRNDAAVLSADSRSLVETNVALSSSGTLTISDPDSPETFVAQAGTAGTYGTFSIAANGNWSWTAFSAHNAFVAGQVYIDTFAVQSADGTQTSVTVRMNGTNDPATISGTTDGSVTEDAVDPTASGTLTSVDPDAANNLFTAASGTSTYGNWSIDAAGAWTYTVDDDNAAVEALDDGDMLADSFVVASIDGTTQTIGITIAGRNDVREGGSGPDIETGGGGTDTLRGLGGDDVLEGGLGDDWLDGGDGIDLASYASASGAVTVDLHTRRSFGADGEDRFTSIEGVVGSGFADILNGSTGGDVMYGGDGDDRLLGRGGDDEMHGGAGNDRYYLQQVGDVAIELADEGTDEVLVYFDGYTLAANIETLRLQGSAKVATGNGLDNLMVGRGGGDTLSGEGGDDTLNGLEGGDVLSGGDGEDRLLGGDGSDTLSGGNGNDRLEGGTGIDTLDGGAGADILIGGAARDVLTGGQGADRFAFGNGDYGGNTATFADRILDFSQAEGDRIDLRQTDANLNAGGDQAFTFLGTAAFTGVAGQLRTQQEGNVRTMVYGDTDGDGAADFAIRLEGLYTLTSGDFLL